jgi:hypothetical protein
VVAAHAAGNDIHFSISTVDVTRELRLYIYSQRASMIHIDPDTLMLIQSFISTITSMLFVTPHNHKNMQSHNRKLFSLRLYKVFPRSVLVDMVAIHSQYQRLIGTPSTLHYILEFPGQDGAQLPPSQ